MAVAMFCNISQFVNKSRTIAEAP